MAHLLAAEQPAVGYHSEVCQAGQLAVLGWPCHALHKCPDHGSC